MKWVLSVTTIIFLFSVFIGTSHVHIANPLIAYTFYELEFFIKYFPLFLVLFCLALLLLTHNPFNPVKKTHHPSLISVVIQLCIMTMTGSLLALIILTTVAFIELNCFALIMNNNPKLLGVTTDTATITSILQKSPNPPRIIASDKSSKKEIVAIAKVTGGTTSFYGQNTLDSIPDFLIFPVKKSPSSLVLITNTLIVTGIVNKDIQVISPVVGYLFIQHYFTNRFIAKYPKVSVMTPKQYDAFRAADAQQKLRKIDKEIKKMEDGISSISGQIKDDQGQIVSNAQKLQDTLKQRDKEYNSCLSTGTYVKGVFQPKFTKDYCQTIIDTWETTIISVNSDGDKLSKTLKKDQQTLKDYQYYDDFFKAQKKLGAITSDNISAELGVFETPDSIKVVVNTNSSHAVADYFETLVHEYLHYASYNSGKRFDSSFFEEGLTEYFARETIKDNLDIDTNTGYPLPVKVISVLTNRLAEVDLADIYFSKDQAGLEHKLDLAYGDGFYSKNYILFESLLYTPDPQDALYTANTLMEHLGEPELKKEDVFSTQSNL